MPEKTPALNGLGFVAATATVLAGGAALLVGAVARRLSSAGASAATVPGDVFDTGKSVAAGADRSHGAEPSGAFGGLLNKARALEGASPVERARLLLPVSDPRALVFEALESVAAQTAHPRLDAKLLSDGRIEFNFAYEHLELGEVPARIHVPRSFTVSDLGVHDGMLCFKARFPGRLPQDPQPEDRGKFDHLDFEIRLSDGAARLVVTLESRHYDVVVEFGALARPR